MDTSPEYVKKCEKATEIQAQWLNHDTEGDFAVPTKTVTNYQGLRTLEKGVVYIVGNDGEYDLTITVAESTPATWLPRQDQLQKMVERRNTRELLMRFADWVEKETDYRRESMEQLWLAFVMKERLGKRWDAEKTEWVRYEETGA